MTEQLDAQPGCGTEVEQVHNRIQDCGGGRHVGWWSADSIGRPSHLLVEVTTETFLISCCEGERAEKRISFIVRRDAAVEIIAAVAAALAVAVEGKMEAHGGIIDPEDGRPKHYRAQFGETPDTTWIEFKADAKVTLADLMQVMQAPYHIPKPADGWRKTASFTEAEKAYLRPIAETLAMLDGNAFFGVTESPEHYEGYLTEADALFQSNGGLRGWAGMASFVKAQRAPDEL